MAEGDKPLSETFCELTDCDGENSQTQVWLEL
jgi:hypothetical protein